MAEVALAPEAEVVTPPEDVANPTPEVTTEGAPEGENQEAESSFIDDILKGIDSESASTADDGKGASTDGAVPSTQALTPEEAKEQGRRERDAEIASQQTATQRQNYINGLNYVVKDVPEKLTALAERYGMTPTDVTELYSQLNRYYGALKPLADYELEQRKPEIVNTVGTEMQRTVAQFMYEAAQEELGDAAVKALQSGEMKTWKDFAKGMFKEARKGYVPAADYTSKKSVKDLLGKYDTALKERGLSLADITGNGGTDLPPARGGNARAGTAEWATNASINEINEALKKAGV